MAMIEELFHEQKLKLIEDRLLQEKQKLAEMSGQAEFQQMQIDLQELELRKLESNIALSEAQINIISAEVKLIKAEAEAREVLDRTRNM